MTGLDTRANGHFVGPDDEADLAVLVVTYQSSRHVESLLASLRQEARSSRLRVIVADNGSTDGTVDIIEAHSDVTLVRTGGNLGYAAGVNMAAAAAGATEDLLVLNPDLDVTPGCIRSLVQRQAIAQAGVVVPRILSVDGETYQSLRREPSLMRALGDATLGRKWPSRPMNLSELERRPSAYDYAHEVDWATGAALLITREAADAVGVWDDRFFLYSEETDFMRRVRSAGFAVWYEPEAVVRHEQGGSGNSVALDTLLTVNRIRYAAKHHNALVTGLFHGVVALHELLRSRQPAHRAALRTVLSPETWSSLPSAKRDVSLERATTVVGSVIIPAHNEAGSLVRSLTALGPLLTSPTVDVVVAANGCSDQTVEIARSIPGVVVLDLPEASKTRALNAADEVSDRWPRLYLDADVQITLAAVCDTLEALTNEAQLAGRPPYHWDLTGASWLVRSYYRARARVPSAHRALWGAGAYALSAAGRKRFTQFPPVVADDLYVDQQFTETEKTVFDTDPVVVRVPRTTPELLKILRRQTRGATELKSRSSSSTIRQLLFAIRGPRSLLDACIYAGLALYSRRTSGSSGWERDNSSRVEFGTEEAR